MAKMTHIVPIGVVAPGQGIPIPEQPRNAPSYNYTEPTSSLVREGNRAVPVQPMYIDLEE